MIKGIRSFASDNNAGVHPAVLQAIADANKDHAVGYGDDPWTERAIELMRAQFGSAAEILFVFNGTGANVVSLSLCAQSYQGVLCAGGSHINQDECGAPERYIGCKLVPCDGENGKLSLEALAAQLHHVGFEHHVQPKVISLSQVNELGLVYSIEELRAIKSFAQENNLYLHMDGARVANAAACLGVSLAAITRDIGVDVLSFGGTKNGLLGAEAVVVFNPELFGRARFLRKQTCQLASKMRFISAQFIAYMTDDLWLKNAKHANAMAKVLEEHVRSVPRIEITRPVQSNAVFARMAPRSIDELKKEFFFYTWDEEAGEVRWMTSFDTTPADIGRFISVLSR